MARMKQPSAQSHPNKRGVVIWGGLVVAIIAVALAFVRFRYRLDAGAESQQKPVTATAAAQYVGGDSCVSCHTEETAEWRKSQHHAAMAQASERSVRGNFNNAKFTYAGVTSTFFKRDEKFLVNTDGPDGKLTDFEIK